MTARSGLTPAQTREAVAIAKRIDSIAKKIVAPLREFLAEADFPPELRPMLVQVVICKLVDLLGEST